MGLPSPDAAVDEERVIPLAGALRHGLTDRVRELIPAPDDEGVERVVRREIALVPSRKRRLGRGSNAGGASGRTWNAMPTDRSATAATEL
mgnify:CR=1 FL=1